MLEELQIKNLAIIDEQSVPFGPGFNVITGQTGAGKSIILQALSIILGGKPKTHAVREGTTHAEVHALFSLESLPEGERRLLPEIIRDESQLVVARSIPRSGSGRVYLNGKLSTIGMLRTVVEPLVDLCGQSEFVRLYDPHYQMRLLDQFGSRVDATFGALLERYDTSYKQWREVRMRIDRATASSLHRQQRFDEVNALIRDVGGTRLGEGVRAGLEDEIKRVANGEQLLTLSSYIIQGVEGEEGVLARFSEIGQELRRLVSLDDGAKPLYEQYMSVWREFSEFHSDFEKYSRTVTVDEEALEKARAELARLAFLERKYRCAEGDLKNLYESALQECADLEGGDDGGALKLELKEIEGVLSNVALELRAARQRIGKSFSELVQNELADLNMKHASLKLSQTPKEWGAYGADEGEFLFSGNRGYAPKHLRSIASGGELSRITLVMKNILSSRHGVSIMVFDEVDVGISGEVARSVGHKLKSLGADSQVICITHLPQVASLADTHLYVEKSEGPLTTSAVRILEEKERVEELARMIAGYQVTESARESARELMQTGASRSIQE
jgi:DNA repair protein RecN (Recombination protein N)